MATSRSKKRLPSQKSDISPAKAHEMLRDGTAHGKPLTKKQKGMLWAIANKGSKKRKG